MCEILPQKSGRIGRATIPVGALFIAQLFTPSRKNGSYNVLVHDLYVRARKSINIAFIQVGPWAIFDTEVVKVLLCTPAFLFHSLRMTCMLERRLVSIGLGRIFLILCSRLALCINDLDSIFQYSVPS